MKKIAIFVMAMGLALGVSAQKVIHEGGHHYHPRAHVVVGVRAFPPYYPYYYDPFFAYSPYFGYPYYYNYNNMPTKLDLQIQDINNKYQNEIWEARHDKSLSRMEKKDKIHALKHERDTAIIQAKKDYYNSRYS